jgi:hypothetical protein
MTLRIYTASISGGVNDALFLRFVHDPAGPIRRDLDRRATNVQKRQQRTVPRKTGTLAATIRKNPGQIGIRPYVEIITGKQGVTDYLGYILYGTHAHEIRAIPNRPNPALRFMSGGGIVFARSVWHPGTKANPFVQESMAEAAK